ncbi:MAG: hypothetical protein JWO36_2559, partial [Myxococcales bacterium]|nr:hypothetical protein [Myxococcales bacterium]
ALEDRQTADHVRVSVCGGLEKRDGLHDRRLPCGRRLRATAAYGPGFTADTVSDPSMFASCLCASTVCAGKFMAL